MAKEIKAKAGQKGQMIADDLGRKPMSLVRGVNVDPRTRRITVFNMATGCTFEQGWEPAEQNCMSRELGR